MGDIPNRSPDGGDFSNSQQRLNTSTRQHSNISPLHEKEAGMAFSGTSQPSSSQSNAQYSGDPFALSSLANSLPDTAYQNYNNIPAQRYSSGPSPSPLMYQMHNMQHFGGQPTMGQPMNNMSYNMGYPPQYQGMYGPGSTQQVHNQQSGLSGGGQQYYQGQGFMGQHQHMGPPFMVQSGQYGLPNQVYPGISGPAAYGGRGGFLGGDGRLSSQQRGHEFLGGSSASGTPKRSSSIGSSAGPSSVVRGPPRKPRQSGHAIWIGNLPPQTDLMSLVLHVCKETTGLESLFLISKSNCAFANYKDEETCSAAQSKIHDSKFQTVRLVSRLRRNSVGAGAGVLVPTGPAALSPPPDPLVARSTTPDSDTKPKEVEEKPADVTVAEEQNLPKDKFFIVKSLTVEDLELSVRNGIWATQSHNEEALNKAYQTADIVYLVFSANKSGEYFGYAKMTSPINDDPAAAIEFAPKAHTVEDPELPKAIPTPASEFAPRGRIIDDSARGTIFWEVERDDIDGVEEEEESQSNRSDEDPDSKSPSKAWGKPFQVEWVSTTRLPFYRTRGLRNPWNSNREVKIARDGTELETSVGRRLLGLFHRLPSPVGPHIPGGALPAMGNYGPQARQF